MEDVRDIVVQYRKFLTEIENDEVLSLHEHEWSDVYDGRAHDDWYIDRYIIIDDVEYCITTSYEEEDERTTYLSEYVTTIDESGEREDYYLSDLESLVIAYDAHNLKDVTFEPETGKILDMSYDFIMAYYPEYDHADEIAWEDDLECALSGDCDDEKLARVKAQWGDTTEELEAAHDELLAGIRQRAYENFMKLSIFKTE